jgi:hypothetical protein
VTGIFKQRRRNKVVATFCLGTRRLYDWIDENPVVELQAVDWVNDPRVIATENGFVSINATTEVDLMGQCASETVAGRYWSSFGLPSNAERVSCDLDEYALPWALFGRLDHGFLLILGHSGAVGRSGCVVLIDPENP